jgi:hypothetical protein
MQNDDDSLSPYEFDSKVLASFKDGTVFNQHDQRLKKYLNTLCCMAYKNEDVRHRAIIMGVALSQILLRNHIRRLNRGNMWIAMAAIIVAILALLKH